MNIQHNQKLKNIYKAIKVSYINIKGVNKLNFKPDSTSQNQFVK